MKIRVCVNFDLVKQKEVFETVKVPSYVAVQEITSMVQKMDYKQAQRWVARMKAAALAGRKAGENLKAALKDNC